MVVAKANSSKKAKGVRLENKVAERYRHFEVDETARRMPLSGAMSHFKSDIYKRYDVEWVDEVKNHETVRLSKFWEQAAFQANMRNPVLHVSANFRPIITAIREADFEYLTDDKMDRFHIVNIMEKKRWAFWDYAKQCTDLKVQATVVYCTVPDEALVLMTIDTYMILRKEAALRDALV